MAIIFFTAQLAKDFPGAVLKTRQRFYGKRIKATDAKLSETKSSVAMNADFNWSMSVAGIVEQWLKDHDIVFGVPKETQLQMVKQNYIQYVADSATVPMNIELANLQAKCRYLKPTEPMENFVKELNDKLKARRDVFEQIGLTDEHLQRDTISSR